jgi:hypothetical protein
VIELSKSTEGLNNVSTTLGLYFLVVGLTHVHFWWNCLLLNLSSSDVSICIRKYWEGAQLGQHDRKKIIHGEQKKLGEKPNNFRGMGRGGGVKFSTQNI